MTKTIQSENEKKEPPPWWPVFAAIERERFAEIDSPMPKPELDGTGRLYEAWADEYARQCRSRAEDSKPAIWAKDILGLLFLALSQEEPVGLESELIYTASHIVAWVEDLRMRRDAKA